MAKVNEFVESAAIRLCCSICTAVILIVLMADIRDIPEVKDFLVSQLGRFIGVDLEVSRGSAGQAAAVNGQ